MAEARRLTELVARVAAIAAFPEGKLIVALSGGADSAALLWMCRHRDDEVRAVHVHHGLAASDVLEQSARGIAHVLSVPLEVARVTIPVGASPENQARQVRYAALIDAAHPDEWILTGHTADDQAETVLARLLRGSGLDGLAAIPPRRPPFARPMLAVTRAETRQLATLAGLPWRDDPANDDSEPLRNRIRRRLIPQLEAEFNPRLRPSLAQTASLVAAEVGMLESMVEDVVIASTDRGVEVAASAVSTLPDPLGARLARRVLAEAGAPSASSLSVQVVLDAAAGRIARGQVAGGLIVERRGAMLTVATDLSGSLPEAQRLEVPGLSRFGDWEFQALVTSAGPRVAPLGAAWMMADADTVGALVVEPAAAHPRILEHLAAFGVPRAERPSYPVVVGPRGPLWLPMVRRLAGDGWVEASTGRYLVVLTRRDRRCRRSKP